MSLEVLVAALASGCIGGAAAAAVLEPRIRRPPPALVRTNYRGARVPAVLGEALSFGALVAVGAAALFRAAGWDAAPRSGMALAVALVVGVMAAAGSWDDHRGDERPRGFRGHLAALRSGRVTGGLVKLAAGGAVGLVAGWLLTGSIVATIEVGLLVALTANLFNLLDRAPGRAAKAGVALGLVLVPFASGSWIVAAAGMLGALVAVLPADLGERAMLGDAGANPLGAVLGLGLATALGPAGRWVAVVVLLALNALSERYSFSDVIARTSWLRRLDDLGRSRN